VEREWVQSIDRNCPTCGGHTLKFEYHHLYSMGDPEPIAKKGTCTCKRCSHKFAHIAWRPAPTKEDTFQKKICDEITEACQPFIRVKNTEENRHELATVIQLVVDKHVLLRNLKERMTADVCGWNDTLYVTLNKLPVDIALKEALSHDPKPTPVVEPLKAAAPEPPVDDEDPFWVKSAGKKIGLPMTVSFNMDEREELEKLLGVTDPKQLLPKIREMVNEYNTHTGINELVAQKMGIMHTRRRLGQIMKEEPDLFRHYARIIGAVLLDELHSPSLRIEAHRDRVASEVLKRLFDIELA